MEAIIGQNADVGRKPKGHVKRTFSLPPVVSEELDKFADEQDRDYSIVVVRALEAYLPALKGKKTEDEPGSPES